MKLNIREKNHFSIYLPNWTELSFLHIVYKRVYLTFECSNELTRHFWILMFRHPLQAADALRSLRMDCVCERAVLHYWNRLSESIVILMVLFVQFINSLKSSETGSELFSLGQLCKIVEKQALWIHIVPNDGSMTIIFL